MVGRPSGWIAVVRADALLGAAFGGGREVVVVEVVEGAVSAAEQTHSLPERILDGDDAAVLEVGVGPHEGEGGDVTGGELGVGEDEGVAQRGLAAQVQQRLGRVEFPQDQDLQIAERAGGPEDAANDATDAEEDDATLDVARDSIVVVVMDPDAHEDRHRDAG